MPQSGTKKINDLLLVFFQFAFTIQYSSKPFDVNSLRQLIKEYIPLYSASLVQRAKLRTPPDGEPIMLDQIGVSHFSFTVDDVMGLATQLMANGVEIPGVSKRLRTLKEI